MESVRRRVHWGVLGTARIAIEKVIPAMRRGRVSEVVAIASRDRARADAVAGVLGVARAYGSYEALLADPHVDAVYIPLPNPEHVPWAIRAAEAGKHVLVEKPVALTADEAATLLAARDRAGVKIQEAFMVRAHPQWEAAIDLVRSGRIGDVRVVNTHFSYRNTDPANIRNVPEFGGGGLMDIGCYVVHVARWIFAGEPARVAALTSHDRALGVDVLTSMVLDFGDGRQAVGTCATQTVPYQRVQIVGERGRIEIQIPFNAPAGRSCRIMVDDGKDLTSGGEPVDTVEADQYTIQGERLSQAILDDTDVALPLEDSVANMRVIDAIVRSAGQARWEAVE
jgi:predicted dehydrogenase